MTVVNIEGLSELFKAFFTAVIPSSFGMLVYKDLTSSVTNRHSLLLSLFVESFLRKSVVSFMYDGKDLAKGWR